MNIYKVTVIDGQEGTVMCWSGTQTDAKAAAKQLQTDFPGSNKPTIEPLDFPTDKAGLLAWLNANFTRDNG